MRLLLIGPQTLYPWTEYTARALRRLGGEVHEFLENNLFVEGMTVRKGRQIGSAVPGLVPILDHWRTAWYRRRDERLLRAAARLKPDLILMLEGLSFSTAFLRRLRETARCPMVTWWVDDPFRYPMDRIFGLFDTLFIFDRSYEERLRREGAADVRFLPCACDETVYRPQRLPPNQLRRYRSEVALVAWYCDTRLETVNALSRFDLRIWGRGWRRPEVLEALNGNHRKILQQERFVPDREAVKIFAATQIGLNIHSGQSHQAGLNARSFDLLASGTFQLVDALPGMEELLEPGKEVAVYRTPAEAADRVGYYLKHPAERAAIAARGRARTLAQHTYLHRMRSMLRVVQS
jgi:spore maturation protein CgeB